MSGSEYLLLDTNIVLYYLKRHDDELVSLIDTKIAVVSVITEIETLSYFAISTEESALLKQFFHDVIIVDLLPEVKAIAIDIRKRSKLKVPDAIVAATAINFGVPLITADKAFQKIDDLKLVFYPY